VTRAVSANEADAGPIFGGFAIGESPYFSYINPHLLAQN
jgi:hypothetical protein